MENVLHPIGTVCKIVNDINSEDNISGHFFKKNDLVRVIDHDGGCDEAPMRAEYLDGSDYWFVNSSDLKVITRR